MTAYFPWRTEKAAEPAPVSEFRFDIQFLRGVAVLLVVLFHGFGEFFPKGFLGVDVFFVISGYLITSIVLKGLDQGSFRFRTFYLRRAKRLLPAAYSTFIVTTLLAYAVLTSPQWSMYLLQLGGALTFTANLVLSQQVGYFDSAAETKPLLHIWSLSLEEQFYFLMPVALWAVASRARPLLIAVAGGASVLACLAAVTRPDLQSLAFFLLPTRAWELLVGSGCAWLCLNRPGLRIPSAVQWLGFALLPLSAIVGIDPVHPRGDALLAVAGTAIIILGGSAWLPRNWLTRPVATVGDWSYSLYLVHWPLFSFAFIAYMGSPPYAVLAGLALLSLLLGWLQYRFVETPFRFAWSKTAGSAWRRFAAVTLCVGLVAVPALVAKLMRPEVEVVDMRRNTGLADACNQTAAQWRDLAACRTSPAPSIAVWGDSNAMHLLPGLAGLPIVQMTQESCPPILGIGQVSEISSLERARSCISFNDSVFRQIAENPEIRVVVMSSPFVQYFSPSDQSLLVDGRLVPWRDVGPEMLVQTIRRLRQAGKTAILVAPVPRGGFDPGACHMRLGANLVTLGRSHCDIERDHLSGWYRDVLRKLRGVAAASGAELYVPEDILCSDALCRTRIEDTVLYRDEGHVTREGSDYLVRQLGLLDRLGADAAELPAPPSAAAPDTAHGG